MSMFLFYRELLHPPRWDDNMGASHRPYRMKDRDRLPKEREVLRECEMTTPVQFKSFVLN